MLAMLLDQAGPQWTTIDYIWMGIGFLGQGIFGGRMLVQWIATERARKSVIPISFWYMSVVGASITLVYAVRQLDPVFIVAQAGGLLVCIRNLYFVKMHTEHNDLIT